ncbi:hypothetical protein HaLaN_14969 [Haematococcus lacustris]|uniref:Uncharacterized protein n=1 Tax=Haematococcus lacustris TaxID=44745 RepID=A0A699ZFQ0_HAELA|nr:hypothetical protein HaLaN_14969 [Haematococcus lacustris]
MARAGGVKPQGGRWPPAHGHASSYHTTSFPPAARGDRSNVMGGGAPHLGRGGLQGTVAGSDHKLHQASTGPAGQPVRGWWVDESEQRSVRVRCDPAPAPTAHAQSVQPWTIRTKPTHAKRPLSPPSLPRFSCLPRLAWADLLQPPLATLLLSKCLDRGQLHGAKPPTHKAQGYWPPSSSQAVAQA